MDLGQRSDVPEPGAAKTTLVDGIANVGPGDTELVSDLGIRAAPGNRDQHLFFTLGQGPRWLGRLGLGCRVGKR